MFSNLLNCNTPISSRFSICEAGGTNTLIHNIHFEIHVMGVQIEYVNSVGVWHQEFVLWVHVSGLTLPLTNDLGKLSDAKVH